MRAAFLILVATFLGAAVEVAGNIFIYGPYAGSVDLNKCPYPFDAISLVFAHGDCTDYQSDLIQQAQRLANAGMKYIISTGGSNGMFTCNNQDLTSFVNQFSISGCGGTSCLVGIDFDIELGQSQAVINNLVQAVSNFQAHRSDLRFSFTLEAGLGAGGTQTLHAVTGKLAAGSFYVNLMCFDYGTASVDWVSACESDINNVVHNYGISIKNMEVTFQTGTDADHLGYDDDGAPFTLSDAYNVGYWVAKADIFGLHYWNLFEDTSYATWFNYGLEDAWNSV